MMRCDHPVLLQRRAWLWFGLACLFLAISLSCSAGQLLNGPEARAVASPTRPPRPTFTPLSGGGEDQVRGALPPGVTVAVSPTAQLPGGTPTPIVLYATPTGLAPQALAMVNTPSTTATARPSPSPAGPTPTPRPTPYVVVNSGVVEARRGPDKGFELLGDVRQGQQLMVLARTADSKWW